MSQLTGVSAKRLTWYFTAALFAYGTYAISSYPAHHDAGWFLYVAGVLLEGGALNRDVVEVNPPLIIWLNMLVELTARVTGLWDFALQRLYVVVIAGLSWVLCLQVIRDLGWDRKARGVVFLLLAYLFVPLSGMEFGQREHLAIMLVLPFLLSSARPQTAEPRIVLQVGVGALAGFGFALKPYFLLPWLLAELYLLRQYGLHFFKRPAQAALIAVLAVYATLLLIFSPDYLAFVGLFADVYAEFGRRSAFQILSAPQALLVVAALTAVAVTRRQHHESAVPVLTAALVGFTVSVFVQSKGWSYHWVPSIVLAVLLLTIILLNRVHVSSRVAIGVSGLALLLLTMLQAHSASARYQELELRPYRLPLMMELVEREAEGGPLAILSTDMPIAFPLVNHTGVPWALRFHSLWPLAHLYEPQAGERFIYHSPAAMAPAERYVFDAVVHDLETRRPTLLIVDTAPAGYRLRGFNYLEYFGQDARFRNLLQSYRELRPVELFRVFKRVN